MTRQTRNAVLQRDVQTLFGFGVVRDSSDRQLLERFLTADHAEAEAAFTFLVERHGPMVLQVCREVLDNSHDAQDAFQATFLVLLGRARAIRKRDSLASWLFGVAMRVARRARYAAIVRRIHERNAGDVAAAAAQSANGDSARLTALHEEIVRLPDRYREPIVLCHLEGLTTAAAAQRLGCPHGTILSRLARGRERLRRRLVQQGQAESMGLLVATSVSPDPLTALSAALVNSTVQYAMPAVSGRSILAATISPAVTGLTHATLRTLFVNRILLAAVVLGTGAAMTAVLIPIFRPSLRAGSLAATIDVATEQNQQQSPTIAQKVLHSRDLEDYLYTVLKRNHEFNDPRWPFVIKVRDVQEKNLIDATFRHRTKGKNNEYGTLIQARRAVLRVDLDAKIVRAFLEHVEIQHFGRAGGVVLIGDDTLEIPIPPTDLLMTQRASPALAEAMSKGQLVMLESDQALSLDHSPDGKILVTAGFDGVVHVWDAVNGKHVGVLEGEKKSTIRSVTFAPDGKTVACVNDAGLVNLWDSTTGVLKLTLPGVSETLRLAAPTALLDSIAFAPDGHLIAVTGGAGSNPEVPEPVYEVNVFDARKGQPMWSHMGRGDRSFSLAFARGDKVLASAGVKTVNLWDARTGEPLRTLSAMPGGIFAVTFSVDGKRLFGGGGELFTQEANRALGHVTVWDVATGEVLRTLKNYAGRIQSIAVSPDGKTVASGGDGPWRDFPNEKRHVSDITLWDITNGQRLWTVEGELGTVRSLAFAPNGKTLVFCDDRVVGIINVQTGKIDRTLARAKVTPRR